MFILGILPSDENAFKVIGLGWNVVVLLSTYKAF